MQNVTCWPITSDGALPRYFWNLGLSGHCADCTATMADRIIGVSLERNVRMVPRHPYVERVVQKEIRQERANDSPYAKGNFSFERVICDWRTRIAVLDLRLKK